MKNILEEILALKQEKDAVILAHFYQPIEIQEMADKVGDSFELAKYAQQVKNPVVVICGVRFMGETIKILSPEKTVLLPVLNAGCQMADMIQPKDVIRLKKEYPDAAVMCYVNSTAALKAECDICCTSSSAVTVAKSLRQKRIIFVPDRNLGMYLKSRVPEKEFILWDGFCPVHQNISENDFYNVKSLHPRASVLVHPECTPEIQKLADFIGSTSQIINEVKQSTGKEFIIGTEIGVTEHLHSIVPEKAVYALSGGTICKNMKKIRLEDVKNSLQNNSYEVTLPQKELEMASLSLNNMMLACK